MQNDEVQPLNTTDKSQTLLNNINQTQTRPTAVTDNQRQPGVNQIDSDSSLHGKTEVAARKKKIIMFSLIGLGVIVVILAIVLPLTLIKDDPNPPGPPDPYNYQEYNPYTHKFNFTTDWRITGHLATGPQKSKAFLDEEKRRLGQVDQKSYKPAEPKNIPTGINNRVVEKAEIKFTLVNNKQARLTIRDATKPVVHIPEEIFPRIVEEHEARFSQLGFETVNTSEPFWFSFNDIYKKKEILSTQKRKLIIQDKYSEIGFRVPTKRIFGVGTANRQFALTNGSYTLYARGREEDVTDDNLGGRQGSSVHPFVLCQTDTQDFFGLYFVNSAASQIEIVYFDNETRAVINYQTTGGTLEVYFFLRGTAQEILQMYHKIIGYPMMPPFYALGFYQGSDSYDNIQKVQNAVDAYWQKQSILEGIMLDNYMSVPFELNTAMTGLDAYLLEMKDRRQRVILESPHKLSSKSQIYTDFKNNGGAIIQTKDGTDFTSNGEVYIDFLHQKVTENYNKGVDWITSKVAQFDGLTLSNNWLHTPSCNGTCPNPTHHEQNIDIESKINLGNPRNEGDIGNHATYTLNTNQNEQSTYTIPFVPGGLLNGNLDVRTISLNATNKLTTIRPDGKKEETTYQQYYMHNLNGHMHLSSLVKSLNDSKRYDGRRPFVLSEGTAPGSGFYGGTWVGNNLRTWANLKTSIAQVMNLNLFGVSVSGTDVCGTIGALDEELCVRWVQATAFFPIQRNYYSKKTYLDPADKQTKPTQPSEWHNFKDGNYTVAAQATISQRYSYLRYIYSQLYVVYRDGGAIVRPLFFDNPGDENAFNNIEDTFMIGDALKVSPCLKQGVNINSGTYTSYFPAGTWADLNDYSKMLNLTNGQMVELTSSKYTNIHLKAGYIVPYQDNSKSNFRVTQDLQTKAATTFIVMRDESLRAEGQILIDDGLSINSYEKDDFTMWKIRYAQKSISFWVQFGNFNYFPPSDYKINLLEEIIILQAEDLKDSNFACYLQKDFSPINLTAPVYNADKKTLTLRTSGMKKVAFHEIGFIKFGNSDKEPNFCDSERAFTYQITKINTQSDTEFSASLVSRLDPEGKLLDKLVFTAKLLDEQGTLNVNITNEQDDKYKIEYVTEHSRFTKPTIQKISDFLSVSKVGESFTYSYLKKGGDVLYKMNPNKFYLTKHLIFDQGQFDISQNNAIFGIGERAGHLFYRGEVGGIHTRYTLDQANPVDDGVPPGRNMYGVQPFYLYQHKNFDYVGVLSLNSYAHDFILYQSAKDNNITNIMIGGKFEKYFFQSQKPDQIVSLYQKLVGYPQLPPFWAFGWQQCRFGYKTDGEWWDVVDRYNKSDLPLDVMWADIDYMDDYKLFTYSKSRYNELPKRAQDLKALGKYFVPIMDPGVAIRDNYSVYATGKQQNIFIRTHDNSEELIGGSWCGDSVFPDFHHPKITDWWGQQWDDLNNQLKNTIDGIWIDVNEATNKCNGYCHPEKQRPKDSLRNKAYYVPGQRDLEDQALGVDGLHANAQGIYDTKNGWREYDVHNLYGLMQVKSSWEYLNSKGLRPYILTRSNYPGIGKWGHHWLADNWSNVEYMKLSVYGLYGYSVFGIPFIGSDICGFNGDAKPDLCTRWHQLGAFYPFSRNHNQNATTSQEPYVFNTPWNESLSKETYTDLIRTSLTERYSLLQYYYSQFYEYSLVGGSFWKPLFFEWPTDPFAYNDIEINIMLGDALKFSIETRVLPKTPVDKTMYYFPAAHWSQIIPSIEDSFQSLGGEPGKISFPSAMNQYQIHIRGGYIVPVQVPADKQPQFRQTKDLINAYTDFYILANEQKTARGFIYYDDGIKNTTIYDKFEMNFIANTTNKAKFSLQKLAIKRPAALGQKYESIGLIKIFGADKFFLDGVKTAIVNYESDKKTIDVVYDQKTKVLTLNLSKVGTKEYSIYKLGVIEFQ